MMNNTSKLLIGAGLLLIGYFFMTNKGNIRGATVNTVTKTLTAIWNPPKEAEPFLPLIRQMEKAYNFPHNMLARLLHQESRYRADIISGKTKSPVGAAGIAQFMPATAAELGINPLDPNQAIPAAAKYLAGLYNKFGSWDKALAAYNWGQGNVQRKGLEKAPTETRNYFAQILKDVGIA